MENQKLGQEPAFPIEENYVRNYGPSTNTYFGISKRFYAACAAMQGLLAYPGINGKNSDKVMEWIAEHAFMQADKLLEQENK